MAKKKNKAKKSKIGGGPIVTEAILSIAEVEDLLKEKVLANLDMPKKVMHNDDLKFTMVRGHQIHTLSDRYKTFFTKGYTCACCGKTASYFALEHGANEERCHLNLYGLDDDGKPLLFTKDHIFPKSKGGKDVLSNYQTMCSSCNARKGNTTEED